jgi:hypothetical protein
MTTPTRTGLEYEDVLRALRTTVPPWTGAGREAVFLYAHRYEIVRIIDQFRRADISPDRLVILLPSKFFSAHESLEMTFMALPVRVCDVETLMVGLDVPLQAVPDVAVD